MRRALVVLFVSAFSVAAWADHHETVKGKEMKTSAKASSSGYDLTTDLWQFEDATPLETCRVDLRLTYRWITANAPANRGDSNDDHIIIPKIVWGAAENLELSANVPSWVGDSGNRPGGANGNYDTNLGLLWRILPQKDHWPAVAFGSSLRVPTGDNSDGVDWEFRLALTNEYDSGIRSHVNVFGEIASGDNDEDYFKDGRYYDEEREWQYGAVVGLDGPLCADGSVRWVADYMWRISQYDGGGSNNLLELGWEWQLSEQSRIGMSTQIGLDDDDTNNLGAAFNYSYSIIR